MLLQLIILVWVPVTFSRVNREAVTIDQHINIGPVVSPNHLGSSGIFTRLESNPGATIVVESPPPIVLSTPPTPLIHNEVHSLPDLHPPPPAIKLDTKLTHAPPYLHPAPHKPPLKPHVPVYKPPPAPRYVHNVPPPPPTYAPPPPPTYAPPPPPPTYAPPPVHHPPPHHLHYEHHDNHYRVPECAYSSRYNLNNTFCLEDEYYPIDTIKYELSRNLPLLGRVLSDVAYQSADNLVDGLTKLEEEGYTYDHYYGDYTKQDIRNYNYSPEYYKRGGYICPSDIYYGRPKRAINTYGEWKVIVNLPEKYLAKGFGHEFARYSQTQRLEQCLYPQLPCSYIHPAVHSRCLQKYSFVRLLAYTRKEGLHVDSFKLPAACSCHVKDEVYYG